MNKAKREAIFARFKVANPHPTTELRFSTPFELLIAVILSAQATDVGVNKATLGLFKVANTPEAILALGEEGLKEYVKTLNLYKTKAAHIIKTCQRLIAVYDGQVPKKREALESLAGVGRKTANVVLNTIFQLPTIAVDTHIFRVSNRMGLSHATTPLGVELQLLKTIPKAYLKDAHHWLVLHGRYVCQARRPQCETCIVRDLCEYPHKTH